MFAGGFDLAAALAVCGDDRLDEYALLDVLDSLVRKSLVTVGRAGGHARYGMLETIRQFAEEQLAATGTIGEVRDCHARYFADQAVAEWGIWDGPRQRDALDWVDVEFANLRAGFRWAADHADLVTAAAIAAHAAVMAFPLHRFEPAGWAEDILEAASAADLPQLPRLYTAASLCYLTGRPEIAVGYAHAAVVLQADPRYEPFDTGWSSFQEAGAHLLAGRSERFVEICTDLAAQPGFAHMLGLCGLLVALPLVGRREEALAIAEETLTAARAHGNPYWIAYALYAYGQAFTQTDPARALRVLREGLAYTQEHRNPFFEGIFAQGAAGLEAVHGDLVQALTLFDTAIDGFDRAGNVGTLAATLGGLAMLFDRFDRPEVAATIYGACANDVNVHMVIGLPETIEHLRAALGDSAFGECAASGSAMELGNAVSYARHQIRLVRSQPESTPMNDP